MQTMGNPPVTQINADYLGGLRTTLQSVLDEVTDQVLGIGPSNDPDTTGWIKPVDGTLTVEGGSSAFGAIADLNTALQQMGGSVHDQLVWLQTVLRQMISEITSTIQSFGENEALNSESVSQLMTDFQQTTGTLQQGPSSGTSGGTPGGG
jgi:hypothetical protein